MNGSVIRLPSKTRQWFVVSCLFVLGLLVFGCSVTAFPQETLTPIEEPEPLLADDFSANEPGSEPAGWNISASTREVSTIQVVEAPELDTKYAVHFKANPTDPAVTAGFNKILSETAASEANKISFDFAMKWLDGGSININLYKGSSYAVNLYIGANGTFGYRHSTNQSQNITVLEKGVWYRVRAVANLETQKVDVYLNDMDNPVLSDYPFRHALDNWVGARVAFSHATYDPAGDVMYGDVKVTPLD